MPRYAAVDIGSNSVRMQAAEIAPGTPLRILASDREVTRLGASVFNNGHISAEAMTTVCAVLRRMSDTYRKLDVAGVRAVATSAVRDASNQADFVAQASEALGAPVEIISGSEEARLIHLGVQSIWPHPKQKVLVVDVGGGSAEFIVSENGELREGVSRPLGAVRLTEVFLKSDPPSAVEMQRLQSFIDDRLDPVLTKIRHLKFDRVIATSATAAAIVSAINRVPRPERDAADKLRARTSQVRKLLGELSSRNLAERKKVPGIGPRRAEIVTAGTAVFLRVLDRLRAPSLYYSVAGVRDGIIADLYARGVGREVSRLNRQQLRVAESMCRKYQVDLKNARQVARLSAELFEHLEPLHKLPAGQGKLLEAAAYLHDTGHFISDTGHHKHSAYLVQNADLPGYTDQERQIIALLCRYHRKSLPAARHEAFRALPAEAKQSVQNLVPLLRIAVGLDTSREQRVERVEVALNNGSPALCIRSKEDADLELWAAERAIESFRQVYGISFSVMRAKK